MLRFGRFDRKRGPDDDRTAMQRMLDADVRNQVLCSDNVYRPTVPTPAGERITDRFHVLAVGQAR